MRKGALEAAAEAWENGLTENAVNGDFSAAQEATAQVVTAYLDSLLGELPEEAVEAAWQAWLAADVGLKWERDTLAESLPAFLTSLRDSLASGQGQGGQDDG